MALVTKTMAQISDGQAYIEVDYQDTNEQVEAIRWANNTLFSVRCRVTKGDSNTELFNQILTPGTSGSRVLTGAERFRLEFITVTLSG